ncbi:Protein of unknown function [Methanobrevibacter millerae]|uniref:DUF2953 domain-containing protein n=1 Tax=Methanobrevibacter millerae TaxID=230361 RepID=A0A1G5X406_9EURY|nr:Protein of unknown function [Methanobrevibacter millerae]
MLNILLMIILLIIILIFIIILIGVRITLKWVKIDSEYDGCVQILILKKLKVYTFDLKSDDDEEEDEDEEDEDEKIDIKKIYKLAKPCFNDFKVFIKQVFNAISINRLENDLVIGFSSFAKTGEYIGYIWAALAVANEIIPNSRLRAQPSFAGEVLNFKGSANIDISIVKLIWPVINLLLKKEVRTLIKGVING